MGGHMAQMPNNDPDYRDYVDALGRMDPEEFVGHLHALSKANAVPADNGDPDTDHAALRDAALADRFDALVHDPRQILGADDTLHFCENVLMQLGDTDGVLGHHVLAALLAVRADAADAPVLRAQCNIIITNEFEPDTDAYNDATYDNAQIFDQLEDNPYMQLTVCSQLLGHADTLENAHFYSIAHIWHDLMSDLVAGRLENEDAPPAPNDAIEQCRAVLRNPQYLPPDILNYVNGILKNALVSYAHLRHQQAEDERHSDDSDLPAFSDTDTDDDASADLRSESDDFSPDYFTAVHYIAHHMDDRNADAAFWAGWLAQLNLQFYAQDMREDPVNAHRHLAHDMAFGARPVARYFALIGDALVFSDMAQKIQHGRLVSPPAIQDKWAQNMNMLVRSAANAPGPNGSAQKLHELRVFATLFCAQVDDQMDTVRVLAEQDAQQNGYDAITTAACGHLAASEMDFFYTTLYRDFMSGTIDAFVAGDATRPEQILARKRYINGRVMEHAPRHSALHTMSVHFDEYWSNLCIPALRRADIMGTAADLADNKPVFKRTFDLN